MKIKGKKLNSLFNSQVSKDIVKNIDAEKEAEKVKPKIALKLNAIKKEQESEPVKRQVIGDLIKKKMEEDEAEKIKKESKVLNLPAHLVKDPSTRDTNTNANTNTNTDVDNNSNTIKSESESESESDSDSKPASADKSVEEKPKPKFKLNLPSAKSKTESEPKPEPEPEFIEKVIQPEQKKKHDVGFADLNEEQQKAVTLGEEGISYCLIGAAGTGKTTTQRVLAQTLSDSGLIVPLEKSTKYLPVGAPSILICSFTNKAVENIRSAVPDEFKSNCLTIHKALEYGPEYYEEDDPETGLPVKKMRFIPQRTAENPLPNITHVIIEEASTVGNGLMWQLMQALPKTVTYIFLGDLNQLPPVMDSAVLGFALNYLPVVELTHVYRQALQSPIIDFAYKILDGKPLNQQKIEKLAENYDPDQLKFIPFKEYNEPDVAIKRIGQMFRKLTELEKFTVENSVVLMPFNIGGNINVVNLNKYIAQGVTDRTNNTVHEIIAGWEKFYYSEEDILFAKKSLWKVKAIERNPDYIGVQPQSPTLGLNRWGKVTHKQTTEEFLSSDNLMDADAAFSQFLDTKFKDGDVEEKKNQASHIVFLESLDNPEETIEIKTAAEFNESQFGYCLTVHKSQGSEWENVYCIFADEHNKMLKRELLYTAVTRARKSLRLLYQPNAFTIKKKVHCSFESGIVKQQIEGKSLEAKLRYFRNEEKKNLIKIQAAAKAECRKDHGTVTEELTEAYYNALIAENTIYKIVERFKENDPEGKTKH